MFKGKKRWMTAIILLLLVGVAVAATTEKKAEEFVHDKTINKDIFIFVFILEILVLFIVPIVFLNLYHKFYAKKKMGVKGTSIRFKILLYFLSIGIIISVIYFIVNTYIMAVPLYQEIDNHILDIAAGKESNIKAVLDDYVDKLVLLSHDDEFFDIIVGSVYLEDEGSLRNKLSVVDGLRWFSFASADGVVVSSTNGSLIGKNIGNMNPFRLGQDKFGAMIISDDEPRLFIYGPFSNGNISGVGMFAIDVSILKDMISMDDKEGYPDEAEIVFRGDDGLPMIITIDPYDTFKRSSLLYDSLDGVEELEKGVIDSRGNKVDGVTRKIDGYDIGLVLKSSGFQTLDLYRDMILVSATVITILLIILIVAGSYVIARNINAPLKKIIQGIKHVEDGNYEDEIVVTTGDEIETLADTFNTTKKALKNIKKEREDLDRMKTQFISITSHELRSPMTPMKAQLQMVLKGYFGKLTKKQKVSLDIVLRNTTRLDKIIMDFLEVSRIEGARLKFHFVKVDVEQVVDSILNEMSAFMPEKNIELVKKIDKFPEIELDPDRLGQVIRNLLNNAMKFTPDNGRIEVAARARKDDILFYVKDSGIGIGKDAQKRIFEPFYQEENSMYRKYSGTGLGLAIIRGIVESQNGEVWLQSTQGIGTTFYFTVPLKPVLEIKSVQLLYSNKIKKESQLRETFERILGPMGEREFDMLMQKGDASAEDLGYYVDYLLGEGIISEEKGKDLLDSIAIITKEDNLQKRGI